MSRHVTQHLPFHRACQLQNRMKQYAFSGRGVSSVSLSETWAGRVRKQSAFSMMCDLQSQGVSDVSAPDWRRIGRNPIYI